MDLLGPSLEEGKTFFVILLDFIVQDVIYFFYKKLENVQFMDIVYSKQIICFINSICSRHGGSHGGSGALGALGALSGHGSHGSHGGHGGHGGHGAMSAGMTGMAGMALSSYLNERQRRKAAKHSGKAGTYILLDFFFKFREKFQKKICFLEKSKIKIQFDFNIQFL